jgi:DNA-binding GntR family transcriptional regulator
MGYKEIYRDIAARILRGDWPRGGVLPTSAEFAAEYKCDPRTIDAAIVLLKERNLVRGVKGGRRYVL